jgi:hypothetical protein
LKPTEEQLEAAYHAVKAWAKQHEALIENASGNNFWTNITDGPGVLSIYWPRFVTKEAGEFAVENGKGRVFAFREDIKLYGSLGVWGIILDAYGGARGQGLYRPRLAVERKYLRWVRRHF